MEAGIGCGSVDGPDVAVADDADLPDLSQIGYTGTQTCKKSASDVHSVFPGG